MDCYLLNKKMRETDNKIEKSVLCQEVIFKTLIFRVWKVLKMIGNLKVWLEFSMEICYRVGRYMTEDISKLNVSLHRINKIV